MDYKIKRNGGFTLIETLFAVLILGLTIVGPLSIASKGLHLALISKDQTTAYYLAQDAVEYIHFARDTNCLTASDTSCPSTNWLVGDGSASATNLTPCISEDASAVCYLDSLVQAPATPTQCNGGVCPVFNYDTAGKNYTYGSGSTIIPSVFTRTITLQYPYPAGGSDDCAVGHDCETLLTVKVTWKDAGSLIHTVIVSESLFNWE